MESGGAFIQVKNLHKSYRNSIAGSDYHVLTGLDLTIEAGEKIAIMGPSGSGKTTLLNVLASFDTPTQGEVWLGNKLLADMPAHELLTFRNKTIGFVFQFHRLLPQCTLLENVLLPTLPQKGDKAMAWQRAQELLQFMGVWELRDKKPAELSGGECQRAAVARALINQPALLLADEPTGSLDTKNAELLIDLLISINQQMGITLVIATHSLAIANRMDKVYGMHSGILRAEHF
jgi:lipoprotein-releasing system ATP-binding protein